MAPNPSVAMPNSHANIQHFYIPEDQSFYLLSSQDAKKLKDWFALCTQELVRLGYHNIELIGKGAFGFAFAGTTSAGQEYVFKFTRSDLPQTIQDRLEEEAYMLSQAAHPAIPKFIAFHRAHNQSILVMERAPGINLEEYSLRSGKISPQMALQVLLQLLDVFHYLHGKAGGKRIQIHGDIKPSNLIWDEHKETLQVIDWGSSVFAQCDINGQYVSDNFMDLMSQDMQTTNARLGDVYFIGDEQLQGQLSSPIFDYQGLMSTIYALCSGQGARFGKNVITPNALGLPKMCADILNALFSEQQEHRSKGITYLNTHQFYLRNLVFDKTYTPAETVLLPCFLSQVEKDVETVVYSSRKSFLREEALVDEASIQKSVDAQFERYYKQYLQGMGDNEKAFITAVSRLGKFPIVGGLAIRWGKQGIEADAHFTLYKHSMQRSVEQSLSNVITLARAIHRKGIFKACLFDAKVTLHFSRLSSTDDFVIAANTCIPFRIKEELNEEQLSREHSYFEDGSDPDENLQLPTTIQNVINELNTIRHSGCIIFEVLPTHMKIHSSLVLFDASKEVRFQGLLNDIIAHINDINDLGMAGFMKLPFKDTQRFSYAAQAPEHFYPRNIKQPKSTESNNDKFEH